jgi:ATP-dependent DNA helicase UvrD/PcrA
MDDEGFPGPGRLGRGLVVAPEGRVPGEAADWPRVRIDADVLADPGDTVALLDRQWRDRRPGIVELAVPFAELKQPETYDEPPYTLDPGFGFPRERLHFLVWANRYDGRGEGPPRWHHVSRALRAGATAPDDPRTGDVVLPDGTVAWIDGGPRAAFPPDGSGTGDSEPERGTGEPGGPEASETGTGEIGDQPVVLHVNQLWAESLRPDRAVTVAPEGLAPDQLAAVAHTGGAARVLAPAGSGKTRVLTARLRHLLVDRGWAPAGVLALAYNTRAAEEMRSRTTEVAGAQVRTLHAFGYEILGHAHNGRPRVVDERSIRDLLTSLAPVKPRANEDVLAPYLEALAEVRSRLIPPEVVESQRDDVPDFAQVFHRYREHLASAGTVDFDEQVYGALEVVLRRPDVRAWVQQKTKHVLLDELQDITPAQLLLVRLLAAPAYDVYGVGDDDQVIYGYAGADPRFLVDYDRYFPAARSYLLEVNYRCPADVVAAASQLLSYNHVRVPKAIRAADHDGRDGDPPGPALEVEQHAEVELGARLVGLVEKLLADGVDPGDIAVLTRVNNGLLVPQVLLGNAGVPVDTPLDERMLDRTGTRAALAWLRLAAGAADGRPLDGPDLAVVARRPSRSLSPGILNALGRGTWPMSRLSGFADGLDQERLRAGLTGLRDDIAELGRRVNDGAPTAAVLRHVRDTVGLAQTLNRLDGSKPVSSSTHVDDLDALVLVAQGHGDPRDFEPWLRQSLGRRAERGGRPGVTLSTVHRVKGLEWPHVVVWDASEGLMPHRLSQDAAQHEEERRVFHVALTRARRGVTVLARQDRPSPFLPELTGEAPHTPRPVVSATKRAADGDGATAGLSAQDRLARRRERKRAGAAAEPAEPLDAEATTRADRLRLWRRQRAQADSVPAYVVVNDRHLDGIARRNPQTLDDLLACDGIGPTKLDRYGDEILATLRDD